MVGKILKLMFTRGLSMKRWNNFPRIEDVSHLDNIGYKVHIALFLAYLEEKNGTSVDREFLIKRIIFNSFRGLVISDIHSGTRDYIMEIDSDIFSEIEKKAYIAIFEKEAPSHIKEDMENTINDNSKTIELDIIFAAKKYAAYRECLVNEKVYSDMYEVPLKGLIISLEKQRKKLKSLDILLGNDNYIKFLSHIRRLSHSLRWNQEKRMFPVSVMSHLVIITFISYVLGKIENDNGGNYNILELMLKSIYHDIPEAITGDIITPTKKSVSGFEEVLERVEIKMMDDYLFYYVEDDYKELVSDYMLQPFEGDHGVLSKKADILSALFEAKVEVNNGATNFYDIYRKIKKKVNSFDSVSVDYFVRDALDSFDDVSDDINLNN
ncbi:HD domain-containing protein [Candidatus Gracilibacteria bacterium 28_42_T64]|nr:HD domain-containing protein [Candidatus Gracilibacteria bacterium 28_42_T64]